MPTSEEDLTAAKELVAAEERWRIAARARADALFTWLALKDDMEDRVRAARVVYEHARVAEGKAWIQKSIAVKNVLRK